MIYEYKLATDDEEYSEQWFEDNEEEEEGDSYWPEYEEEEGK